MYPQILWLAPKSLILIMIKGLWYGGRYFVTQLKGQASTRESNTIQNVASVVLNTHIAVLR